MATWTAAQLAQAVLERIGVCGAGQTATAEDAAVVTSAYASIYPQLRRHGIAPWSSGAIEEEAQWPLCKYLAAEVASTFGIVGEQGGVLRMEGVAGFKELQEQASGDRQPVRIVQRYY